MSQGKGGAQGKAGALTGNQGGQSGPQGGQATGQRPGGTPEDVNFNRERIQPKGMDPRGGIVGSFVADGPAPEGEARVRQAPALLDAVQQLSEEVEKEPLPVEHREHIQKFHELLTGGESP